MLSYFHLFFMPNTYILYWVKVPGKSDGVTSYSPNMDRRTTKFPTSPASLVEHKKVREES